MRHLPVLSAAGLRVVTMGTAAQSPETLLASLQQQAHRADAVFSGPSAERGATLFRNRHGGGWSCASCHTADPRQNGRHAVLGSLLSGGMLLTGTAHAGDDRYAATSPVWQAERGSCHLAYPPELLPAGSWHQLFGELESHFGSDASLDAEAAAALLREAQARAPGGDGSNPLRITGTPWFRREHRKLDTAVWQRSSIGLPANCAACHRDAKRGEFSDDLLRIPR